MAQQHLNPDTVFAIPGLNQVVVAKGARQIYVSGQVPTGPDGALQHEVVHGHPTPWNWVNEALVFPSEYEGFGAPVIEAMTLGTPVLASDRAALAEVVGDAGLVRPLVVDAWIDALDTVRTRRADLVAAGNVRAAAFTTAASGDALADAYRLALAVRA